MTGKRTQIDFSKHEIITLHADFDSSNDATVHYLKIPGTRMNSIKYMNIGGILAVTGDFGNWIFCREFHPGPKEGVSDGYWHEKLSILSVQEALDFDGEGTKKALQEKLTEYKEEHPEDADEDIIEYYEECMNKCDDHELDYTHFAYREQPRNFDYEDVIIVKDYKPWLKAVFDGFEEICRRMKENEIKQS